MVDNEQKKPTGMEPAKKLAGDAASTVGDIAATGAETAGNVIGKGAEMLGNKLSGKGAEKKDNKTDNKPVTEPKGKPAGSTGTGATTPKDNEARKKAIYGGLSEKNRKAFDAKHGKASSTWSGGGKGKVGTAVGALKKGAGIAGGVVSKAAKTAGGAVGAGARGAGGAMGGGTMADSLGGGSKGGAFGGLIPSPDKLTKKALLTVLEAPEGFIMLLIAVLLDLTGMAFFILTFFYGIGVYLNWMLSFVGMITLGFWMTSRHLFKGVIEKAVSNISQQTLSVGGGLEGSKNFQGKSAPTLETGKKIVKTGTKLAMSVVRFIISIIIKFIPFLGNIFPSWTFLILFTLVEDRV